MSLTIEDMQYTLLPVVPPNGGEDVPRSPDGELQGWVHATESFATSDGPGIRFVVYMQGCPLRCQYCHNPDARAVRTGTRRTVAQIMDEIRKGKAFYTTSGGGVTISGGEPLLQPQFVAALMEECHKAGFTTALDTSGYANREAVNTVLPHADLVLLDLKSWDWETHRQVTGVDPLRIRCLAQDLAAMKKPVWIRFVLVPSLTDNPENIAGIAYFASHLGNVERVDVLPFHKMGEEKWERLHLEYRLKDTPVPTETQVAEAVAIFRDYGLNAC